MTRILKMKPDHPYCKHPTNAEAAYLPDGQVAQCYCGRRWTLRKEILPPDERHPYGEWSYVWSGSGAR